MHDNTHFIAHRSVLCESFRDFSWSFPNLTCEMCVCVCVWVCVRYSQRGRKRQGERQRSGGRERKRQTLPWPPAERRSCPGFSVVYAAAESTQEITAEEKTYTPQFHTFTSHRNTSKSAQWLRKASLTSFVSHCWTEEVNSDPHHIFSPPLPLKLTVTFHWHLNLSLTILVCLNSDTQNSDALCYTCNLSATHRL